MIKIWIQVIELYITEARNTCHACTWCHLDVQNYMFSRTFVHQHVAVQPKRTLKTQIKALENHCSVTQL